MSDIILQEIIEQEERGLKTITFCRADGRVREDPEQLKTRLEALGYKCLLRFRYTSAAVLVVTLC